MRRVGCGYGRSGVTEKMFQHSKCCWVCQVLQLQIPFTAIIFKSMKSQRVRRFSESLALKLLSQNNTPDTSEHLSQNPQLEVQAQNFSLMPQKPYQITHDELIGPKISQSYRYKLMKWVLTESTKRNFTREVFALTCYYLDLYFQKLPSVQLEKLQLYGLGAMLIATKIEGVNFPEIGGDISKIQILDIQKEICLSLQYLLNPKTYIQLMDNYIQKWDAFMSLQEDTNEENKYLSQTSKCYQRIRSLCQRLQFINMAGSFLKYGYEDLTLNLFMIENRANMEGIVLNELNPFQMQFYIKSTYDQDLQYRKLFDQFMEYYRQEGFGIRMPNQTLGGELSQFLRIRVESRPPSRLSINYQMYMRLQTCSPEGIKQLDKIVKRGR